jgi:aminocarboxymuconate-semialdehyde decarboxylase
MSEAKVDVQALSLAQPGVYWAEPEAGLTLCQIFNDEIHGIIKKYPQHFVGIASVPLQDINGAIRELDRAISDLDFKGVLIGTNINGLDLDTPQFFPFYQRAEQLKIPIFVHPFAWDLVKERLANYRLEPILGFMFENSIAILKVVLGGVLERYPKLKFCFAHLGGTIPYIKGRIDRGDAIFAADMRTHISQPHSFYLRKVYFDTAYFYDPAFLCALSCISEEQFAFGTDHPFTLNNTLDQAISQLQQASISETIKQKILMENPTRLLWQK